MWRGNNEVVKEKNFHLGVKALIQNEAGKVLILKVNQKKFIKPGQDHWDIPGGRVLEGTTIEDTLLREIEEEIGAVKLQSMTPFDTIVSNMEIPLKDGGKVGLILTVYLCTVKEPINVQLSEEHIEYAWVFPQEAMPFLAYKYSPSFIDKLNNLILGQQKQKC